MLRQGRPRNGGGDASTSSKRALLMASPLGGDSDGEDAGRTEENESRAERFGVDLAGNRFRELEPLRAEERKAAIKAGLIADPEKRTTLEDAINFRGTCTDMCPEFEREEREFKKNVHPLEQREGMPGRIDPAKAVTIYHRSAAGIDQPLPSDVRDPPTLKRTLDHLFHAVMTTPDPSSSSRTPLDSLRHTHHFIRDRTRGIRQDFTYQSSWGKREAIECHERIARFHILSMHELAEAMAGEMEFLKQEAEQLNKTLVTLTHLYDDERVAGRTSPNEPEFRSYQLMSHLHDNEVASSILLLPAPSFNHPLVQLAFDFRALAQRNFDIQKVGSKSNTEIALNWYTRFFKLAKKSSVPFLMACLAHHKVREIRRAALRALQRSYPRGRDDGRTVAAERYLALDALAQLLGCDSAGEAAAAAAGIGFQLVYADDAGEEAGGEPIGALINTHEKFNDNLDVPHVLPWPEIRHKMGGASYQEIIDRPAAATAAPPVLHLSTQAPPARIMPATNARPTASASAPAPGPASRPALSVSAPAFQPKQAPATPAMTPQPTFAFIPPTPQPSDTSRTASLVASAQLALPPPTTGFASRATVNLFAPPQPRARPAERIPSKAQPQQPALDFRPVYSALQSQLIEDACHRASDEATRAAIARETAARLTALAQEQASAHQEKVDLLSAHLYDDLLRKLVDKASGAAAADERYSRRTQTNVFRFWQWRAETSREIKRQRERSRSIFAGSARSMHLGVSQIGQPQAAVTARESAKDPSPSTADVWDVQLAQSVRQVMTRRNILEEGTFASIVGNHIVNMPGDGFDDDDDDEAGCQVVVCATEAPTGHWLRSKLNVARADTHVAAFHGLARDGVVSLLDWAEDQPLPQGTTLVVFECGSDGDGAGYDRFSRMLAAVPELRDFAMGILLITWSDEDLTRTLRSIDFDRSRGFFHWAYSLNMRQDASDEAFERGLHVALPELRYTATVEVPIEDYVDRLRSEWEGLLAVCKLSLPDVTPQDPAKAGKIYCCVVGHLRNMDMALYRMAAACSEFKQMEALPVADDLQVKDEDSLVAAVQSLAHEADAAGKLCDAESIVYEDTAKGPEGLSAAEYLIRVLETAASAVQQHFSDVVLTVSETALAQLRRDMDRQVAAYGLQTRASQTAVLDLAKASMRPVPLNPVAQAFVPGTNGRLSSSLHQPSPPDIPSRKRSHDTAIFSAAATTPSKPHDGADDSRMAKLRKAIARANDTMNRGVEALVI